VFFVHTNSDMCGQTVKNRGEDGDMGGFV
jgi:hypothetical protein